jgi:hypothetical protein
LLCVLRALAGKFLKYHAKTRRTQSKQSIFEMASSFALGRSAIGGRAENPVKITIPFRSDCGRRQNYSPENGNHTVSENLRRGKSVPAF